MKILLRISSVTFAFIIFCSTLAGIVSAVEAETYKPMFDGEIIRFHVIANSDTDADQALKLKVRDAVLAAANEDINQNLGYVVAKEKINTNLNKMKDAAQRTIYAEGYNYNVEILTGIFEFPAKTYGNITLPKGRYEAVRVIIGEGKGQNWWCVMFPPLCFVDETKGYIPDADEVVSAGGKYKIKFKTAEIFK